MNQNSARFIFALFFGHTMHTIIILFTVFLSKDGQFATTYEFEVVKYFDVQV